MAGFHILPSYCSASVETARTQGRKVVIEVFFIHLSLFSSMSSLLSYNP